MWKTKELNDLRPVALTSLVMKSFERLVKGKLLEMVDKALDPKQFAYRAGMGVEDAQIIYYSTSCTVIYKVLVCILDIYFWIFHLHSILSSHIF